MHELIQFILSIIPFYFNFPIDKLPDHFIETVYISKNGEYQIIDIIDYTLRKNEIKLFFITELNNWSYYQTIVSYIPGYELKSDNMIIEARESFVVVRYKEGEHWIQIMKETSHPFPILHQ
jgi:hypothetical protein